MDKGQERMGINFRRKVFDDRKNKFGRKENKENSRFCRKENNEKVRFCSRRNREKSRFLEVIMKIIRTQLLFLCKLSY